MTDDSRINVAGLRAENLEYVARATAQVLAGQGIETGWFAPTQVATGSVDFRRWGGGRGLGRGEWREGGGR